MIKCLVWIQQILYLNDNLPLKLGRLCANFIIDHGSIQTSLLATVLGNMSLPRACPVCNLLKEWLDFGQSASIVKGRKFM